MNTLTDPASSLPRMEGCPEDFTYRTTLLNKGRLAKPGYVWLELRVAALQGIRIYVAPIMKGLSPEQKEYFAQKMRIKIKEENI